VGDHTHRNIVAGLEVGGRAILTYATDAILYKRFKGLECFLSILVLVFELQAEKAEILAQFSADSALIANTKNSEILATRNQYRGKVTKYKKSIENYTRKEQKENVSYVSRKNYLLGKIAEFESERDGKTAKLENEKGAELKALLTAKKQDITTAKATHTAEKNRIQQSNDKTTGDHEQQKATNKGSLQYLVYACLFLFSICVIVERIIYKEAGIKFEYHFSENFYNESVLSAWFGYVAEAWKIKAHGTIEKWRTNLKEATIYSPTIRRKRVQLKPRRNDDTEKEDTTTPKAYENRMTTKSRQCAYCSDEYTYNHAKQKYCSDACRKRNWEEKNGRALKLKKKKIA